MRWTGLVPVGLSLAAAACDVNPFDGPDTVAEYELVSIAGDPLPAAFVVNEVNQPQVVVVSSRLFLRPDGRGEERSQQRYPQDPGQGTTEYTVEFDHDIDGNEIRISYDCPGLASCIAGPHLIGRLSDEGIVIQVALGRTPMIYRRR